MREESRGVSFDYDDHGLTRGAYLLFACGRLDSTKGLHWLLDAYQGRSWPEPLLVVGDFNHDAAYSEWVESRAGRDPRIVLHKRLLERETLFDVIDNSRVCVFPSEIEAMSMMLLEFISRGKRVVCSDIVENVEVVGGAYPWLFRSGDPEDLGRKISAALDEQDGAVEDDLRAKCLELFDWSTIASTYGELYEPRAALPR